MKYIKTILLGLFLLAFCFSSALAANLYCQIDGAVVVDGPKRLPNGWNNISGFDNLSDAELKALGWLPYVNNAPEYNSDLQYLTSVNVVGEDAVTKTYTVNDYTAPQMAQRILDAQAAKVVSLKSLARSKALVQYSKWVNDRSTAIDALETLEAIRDYELTTPDFDTISTNILVAIAASGIADMTFAALDTYVETTFSNLPAAQQTALKKAFKAVLALVKLQMGNE